MWSFIIVFCLIVIFFLFNLAPVDLTAAVGALLLFFLGFIPTDQLFAGFSSSSVIILLSTFFLATALKETGIAYGLASQIHKVAKDSMVFSVFGLMLSGALLSAFISNSAAVIVLLPTAISLSQMLKKSPSKFLIPLAFSTILGGMLTVVGTTANIIAADIVFSNTGSELELFEFLPLSFPVVLCGIMFVSFFGVFLIPNRVRAKGRRKGIRAKELRRLYKLEERIFSIKVSSSSSFVGKTLGDMNLNDILGCQVLAIIGNRRSVSAPRANELIQANDELIVKGKLDRVRELFFFQNIKIKETEEDIFSQTLQLKRFLKRVKIINDSYILDKTVKDINFRQEYNASVVAIKHGGKWRANNISKIKLKKGQELLLYSNDFSKLNYAEDFVVEQGNKFLDEFFKKVKLLLIDKDGALVNKTVAESKLGELLGLNVIAVIRQGKVKSTLEFQGKLKVGDGLLVVGDTEYLNNIKMLSELKIINSQISLPLKDVNADIVEGVITPRSTLIGKTLREVHFSSKYGVQVVALWREGGPVRTNFADKKLQLGDAILLYGNKDRLTSLEDTDDFILVDKPGSDRSKKEKAPLAILGLLITIGLALFNIVPLYVATFMGAMFVVVTQTISMHQAYKEIDWRIIFLVAFLIPIGKALQNTGLVEPIADLFIWFYRTYGELSFIFTVIFISSAISQMLDSSIVVVLLSPILLYVCNVLMLDIKPVIIISAISASLAFLTPFSHKANLVVVGAGGYKVIDYFKVGSILTILSFALLLAGYMYFFYF